MRPRGRTFFNHFGHFFEGCGNINVVSSIGSGSVDLTGTVQPLHISDPLNIFIPKLNHIIQLLIESREFTLGGLSLWKL